MSARISEVFVPFRVSLPEHFFSRAVRGRTAVIGSNNRQCDVDVDEDVSLSSQSGGGDDYQLGGKEKMPALRWCQQQQRKAAQKRLICSAQLTMSWNKGKKHTQS